YGIARTYGIEVPALARVNGLVAPYKLLIGQTLSIPGKATRGPRASPVPSAGVAAQAEPPARGGPAPPTASVTVRVESLPPPPGGGGSPRGGEPSPGKEAPSAALTPHPAPPSAAPVQAVAQTNASIPRPPKRSGQPFLWPIPGKMLNRYGALGDGTHNDGINIAAPRGTPVRAALLIRHADNLLTAYAHHDTILVRRGDTVKRGQIVGTVGMSGGVGAPQLHFEVREGVKAVDPVPYLEPAPAA
ncbi:MAG: membrane protein related to metalloendopeptidase, partial [Rhodospirillaceae bacterium]